ncbi:MAG: ATP-binding protein [Rhodoferax sp.]|nr:ATP-binding protein [Rhodoferax sp.]
MRIAILGAECTGKTRLAQALVSALKPHHPHVSWVSEYLRAWCDAHGRTPRADEQAHIAQVQMQRIQAAPAADLVLCDTTPLMTALYSELLLGDPYLLAGALQTQKAFGLTLVTGLDLPWVADGIQRDGEAVRTRADQRLRTLLQQHGIAYSLVYGTGEARTQCALQAIDYALGTPSVDNTGANWKWNCEKCSDPACEHRLFRGLIP